MVLDIHSHTYYSHCGRDDPHLIIDEAVKAGYDIFGICDHNHGVICYPDGTHDHAQEKFDAYLETQTNLREEYKDKITLWRGIEVCTEPNYSLPDNIDISNFDYALIECIDHPSSIISVENGKSRVFDYVKKLGCKCGIAHTDLFGFISYNNWNPLDFFKRMKENNMFWEMNVSYDSIHSYREHQYVKDFMANEEFQDIIRKSGVEISVGFDGHRVEDYRPDRVINMCQFLEERQISLVKLK